MRASKTVTKLNQIERRVESASKDLEGKVQKFLAKNGPADRIAKEVDAITAEAGRDIERLAKKWTKKLQEIAAKVKKG